MAAVVGKKLSGRARRQRRVRSKVAGTAQRPRLSVFRSLRHLYAQVIDDEHGVTLASASTDGLARTGQSFDSKTAAAKQVGMLLAERCKEKSIAGVVFDRAGYRYHGRVKAVAEGAREGGLAF